MGRARNEGIGPPVHPVSRMGALSHGEFVVFCVFFQDAIGDFDHFRIDLAIARDGVRQRERLDLVSPQRRHLSPFAAMHHVDGAQAVAGGKHAVEGTGRAAALDVAKHRSAGFEAGALFDFARQEVADPTQPRMAELVLAQILHDAAPSCVDIGELGAFGRDHDAEVAATGVSLANQCPRLCRCRTGLRESE